MFCKKLKISFPKMTTVESRNIKFYAAKWLSLKVLNYIPNNTK